MAATVVAVRGVSHFEPAYADGRGILQITYLSQPFYG